MIGVSHLEGTQGLPPITILASRAEGIRMWVVEVYMELPKVRVETLHWAQRWKSLLCDTDVPLHSSVGEISGLSRVGQHLIARTQGTLGAAREPKRPAHPHSKSWHCSLQCCLHHLHIHAETGTLEPREYIGRAPRTPILGVLSSGYLTVHTSLTWRSNKPEENTEGMARSEPSTVPALQVP